MENPRKHGSHPYGVAVIHGGPGVPGEMVPVAEELSKGCGILEPLQTKSTIKGQLQELKGQLLESADLPIVLIGHSWGAVLGFMFAADYPSFVKKLILVSSAVFEESSAEQIMATRFDRLTKEDRDYMVSLSNQLVDSKEADTNRTFQRLGKIIEKADSFDSLPHGNEVLDYQYEIYDSVWKEFLKFREGAGLSVIKRKIECPIVAIHGDYDPHPAESIRSFFSDTIKDFRFILLKDCGHYPWRERRAKDEFLKVLKEECQVS